MLAATTMKAPHILRIWLAMVVSSLVMMMMMCQSIDRVHRLLLITVLVMLLLDLDLMVLLTPQDLVCYEWD